MVFNPEAGIKCLLCHSDSSFILLFREIEYYRCRTCNAVFMANNFHPSPEREKNRYEKHNNDIHDPGYRRFVRPLVDKVIENTNKKGSGLDFGAGPGPVAANILRSEGYRIVLYDPFFWKDEGNLEKKYDYIICSEVIEHFHKPDREFGLLRSLLRNDGSLFCMTEIYDESIDFEKWWYKNDETHVFFYHRKSLEWIRSNFRFSGLKIDGKIIHLKAT